MLKKAMPVLILFLMLSFFVTDSLLAKDSEQKTGWQTRVKLSYENTSGNTDTQNLSGTLELKKEGDKNRFYINSSILFGTEGNEETKDKWSIDTRWERYITERLFGLLSSGYQYDRFLDYDYRIFLGPGLGYEFLKTERHLLKGYCSTSYYYERYDRDIGQDKRYDSYVSGDIALDYKYQILVNLIFKEAIDYSVSFEDSEKRFIDSETSLEVDVNEHISFDISYIINYRHAPLPDKRSTDKTFLTSLILKF